jgi:type III restriction enzyme
MLKIKFDRLDYQEKAVGSISDVFKNIAFVPNENRKSNPSFDMQNSKNILIKNIESIREKNKVSIGEVSIKDELSIDTLMETGTGKTFTFLETIYKLNHDYGLSKFIILVPSNPIRQGTLKNIKITKEFFLKEYEKNIATYNYNEKTILSYINASDQNISVLVATYQSFNKAKNTINKRSIERSLLGRAKSYMEAVAALKPVIIIDEPHRFEGKQTAEYLKKFSPLFTLRFGATFKDDVYKNLIYTLDSIDAFSRGLVKAITVDTVGNENVDNHTITLKKVHGSSQKDYEVSIEYKDINSKTNSIKLKKGDNLGEQTGIEYLSSYVIEKITKSEVVFTNEISLPLGQNESYGLLLDEMQRVIVDTAIKNHFEREEELFKLRIKSLCLFFIDGVDKYKKDDGSDGELAKLFERLYAKNLDEKLKEDLDEEYREYLLRTKEHLGKLHDGYFAKSKNLKDEEEAIDLILNKKEELLSFDTDLRFIFSQWALQEGWDNPNVMTLAKLAPSNSKISKLQQIGRGLRLAVDQDGQRITKEHERFDFINELFVVVPSTEENFVTSIQNEISEHSIKQVARVFNVEIIVENKIATNAFTAVGLLTKLQENKFIEIDDEGNSEIVISKEDYNARSKELESLHVKGCDNEKLKEYFDSFFKTTSRIKSKDRSGKKDKGKIKIDQEKFKKFKNLWDTLNYNAVVKYDINSADLIKSAVTKIDEYFTISGQDIIIKRDKNVEDKNRHDSDKESVTVETHSIFTIYEFIKALSNKTKLSFQTIARVLKEVKKEKFDLIAQNENAALQKLEEQLVSAIYDTIINKISYDIKEIRVCNTSLTDKNGNVKACIDEGSLGAETYKIASKNIRDKSIYDEDFMEVDSVIEKTTIDESDDKRIVVFAKLPRVNIPTAHGRTYNPDFGYVIEDKDKKELYFVAETKGYDAFNEISDKEKLKIKSAEAFFKKLKEKGINVTYKTKLNSPELSQMINDILKER